MATGATVAGIDWRQYIQQRYPNGSPVPPVINTKQTTSSGGTPLPVSCASGNVSSCMATANQNLLVSACKEVNALETCTPVPTNPKAKAAYRRTLMVASQTVSEVAHLEGWSTANNPSQGVIPGVCYNDQGGHGTVGYGHEYPGGHSCAYLASTDNVLYETYLKDPLHPNGPHALALLQSDIATSAVAPIIQHVAKEITVQQFNALIPWVFNIGGGGLLASAALAAINACQWNQVPGDFTHYDHIGSQVSCGLYTRDRVSGHYWNQGTWVPRSTFTASCPAGALP